MKEDEEDIIGHRFGRLTVIRKVTRTDLPANLPRSIWLAATLECRCDCGTLALYHKEAVIRGNTESCGCGLTRKGGGRKQQRQTTSRFKGVYLEERTMKWRARVQKDGKKHGAGTYANEEDAARAYDAALIKMFGASATTNKRLGLFQKMHIRPKGDAR